MADYISRYTGSEIDDSVSFSRQSQKLYSTTYSGGASNVYTLLNAQDLDPTKTPMITVDFALFNVNASPKLNVNGVEYAIYFMAVPMPERTISTREQIDLYLDVNNKIAHARGVDIERATTEDALGGFGITKYLTPEGLGAHNNSSQAHDALYNKMKSYVDASMKETENIPIYFTQAGLSFTRPSTAGTDITINATTTEQVFYDKTLVIGRNGQVSPNNLYWLKLFFSSVSSSRITYMRVQYFVKGVELINEVNMLNNTASEFEFGDFVSMNKINQALSYTSTDSLRIVLSFWVSTGTDTLYMKVGDQNNTSALVRIEPVGEFPASKINTSAGGTDRTQEDFNNYILNLTGNPYGIEWDITVSNPKCTRIGSMDSHRTLPIQSKIRRCLLNDDGTVNYYLDPNDSTKKEDGSPAVLDGTDGQVMVEIPDMYVRFDTDGNKRRAWMSEIQMAGFQKWNKCYVSAYEATVDRTVTATPKLASVVNLTPAYRGGGNTPAEIAHDADGGTSLGKPATSISLTNFRNYARNRGSVNWNCYTYQAHKMLFWLFAVEYATFNSQDTFNAALTTEGYHQGGLGAGVTDLVGADITSMTGGARSCIPCGISNSLGNKSGVIPYVMPAEYGSVKTTNVPSYRGIENPFGHLNKWTDGCKALIYATTDKNVSEFYTADNPNDYSSSGLSGYKLKGLFARTASYIKEILNGESGDIVPKVVGGSSTTYFCDYFDTNVPASGSVERGVLFGGTANYGASAGFVYSNMNDTAANANVYIGSRLCFIPTL